MAYRNEIEKYAAENGIHPAYVAAIILRESSYDPKATSSVGARGLMQVMESTFEFVRKKLGEDNTTFADMLRSHHQHPLRLLVSGISEPHV